MTRAQLGHRQFLALTPATLSGKDTDRHRRPMHSSMADSRTAQLQLSRLPKCEELACMPTVPCVWAYTDPSQWRHIDLNEALFAQSGGGKTTLFRTFPMRREELTRCMTHGAAASRRSLPFRGNSVDNPVSSQSRSAASADSPLLQEAAPTPIRFRANSGLLCSGEIAKSIRRTRV